MPEVPAEERATVFLPIKDNRMESNGNAEKMAALIRMLRRDINGAVTERMEELGIHYACNWGVSLPAVRRAAAVFAPDHEFARFLYGKQLRELLLSAFVIADPQAVTAGELAFWGAGVKNAELAENLAFSLLSRTALAVPLAGEWLADDAPVLLQYSALLALARMRDGAGRLPGGLDAEALAVRFSEHGSALVRGAAAHLLPEPIAGE